jgi:hypothetical protein
MGRGTQFLGVQFPLVTIAAAYRLVSFIFIIRLVSRNELDYFIILPLIFVILHTAYGICFLCGLKRLLRKNKW